MQRLIERRDGDDLEVRAGVLLRFLRVATVDAGAQVFLVRRWQRARSEEVRLPATSRSSPSRCSIKRCTRSRRFYLKLGQGRERVQRLIERRDGDDLEVRAGVLLRFLRVATVDRNEEDLRARVADAIDLLLDAADRAHPPVEMDLARGGDLVAVQHVGAELLSLTRA